MRLTNWIATSALAVLGVFPVCATTITGYTGGTFSAGGNPTYEGQSFLTPSGGPWDDLTFNFFSDSRSTTPSAAGMLYLFDRRYTAAPAALSTAVVGYLASTNTIIGGKWVFSPTVTIQPGTEYYVYADTPVPEAGQPFAPVANQESFSAGSATGNFGSVPGDSNFNVSGDAVTNPEPSTFVMIFLPATLAVRRRLKASIR